MIATYKRLNYPTHTRNLKHTQVWEIFPYTKFIALPAGVDLTAITGIGLETALLIVSELGADVSAFPWKSTFVRGWGGPPTTRLVVVTSFGIDRARRVASAKHSGNARPPSGDRKLG